MKKVAITLISIIILMTFVSCAKSGASISNEKSVYETYKGSDSGNY